MSAPAENAKRYSSFKIKIEAPSASIFNLNILLSFVCAFCQRRGGRGGRGRRGEGREETEGGVNL